jgi:hypothetical protein
MTSKTIETAVLPPPESKSKEIVSFCVNFIVNGENPYIVPTVMVDDKVSYAEMTQL